MEKRLLSEIEATEYTGLKRSKIREFGTKYNVIKHIGRRVLYDKQMIDRILDEATSDEVLCEKEVTAYEQK